MTQPVLEISKAKKPAREVPVKPPLLNGRVFIGRYTSWNSQFEQHCKVIRKCGLVAEVEAADGLQTVLYASRRRPRNKHD